MGKQGRKGWDYPFRNPTYFLKKSVLTNGFTLTSSYSDFYEYIKYYNLCDEKNILFKKMTEQMSYDSNWSDFELIINTLVLEGKIQQNKIEKSIDEFQNCFTRFLNDLVDVVLCQDLVQVKMRFSSS